MFGSLGFPELILIFIVALVVFGPRRLPDLGRSLGKALAEFKKATDELKNTIEREVRVDEIKRLTPVDSVPPGDRVSRSEPVIVAAAEPVPIAVEPHVAADAAIADPVVPHVALHAEHD